jgi:TATA-binding protein-associated factor Taf7
MKCCGISNNINGLEDTLIFDFDKLREGNTRSEIVHDSEEEESDENDENDENDESGEEREESDDESELDYYRRNEVRVVIHNWG